jgi:hypothetical protein
MNEELLYRIGFFFLLGGIVTYFGIVLLSDYPKWIAFCVSMLFNIVVVAIVSFLFDFIGGSSRD